ncbi:MAG TPA: serine protein kinase PrkA [Polyangia bacterium]|jgi:predicted Ser/Thr protein kinase
MPDAKETLSRIGVELKESFARNKRVMSFAEYLELFLKSPERQARSSAQYLKDVFDHYGTEQVRHPRGALTRFKLFDAPFDDGRERLIGQEEVQHRVYRVIANFVREGRSNKLILLHGPNGSAKSTFVSCLMRALEHYSTTDEGALYRFNWIFPTQRVGRSGMGFAHGGGAGYEADGPETYAYLPDDEIEAKLPCDLRDHPLFLLPQRRRAEILREKLAGTTSAGESYVISDYILHGDLGHKNRQFMEALLTAYNGDYLKVLRHVQVERFFISRRYREAAVTVEPQLAIDARAQRLTMDRSLSALPSALQNVSIYEYGGDLVDANRGIIEYSDLLKRPLEAYKYLLGTVENGRVPLENAIIFLDLIFIGSSNEGHLAVFKEIPEFQSFKARIELVRVPYILDWRQERQIYAEQVRPQAVGKHIAPHAVDVASLWAVLTRIRKPLPEKYTKTLAEIVAKLTPLEKAELYSTGRAPDRLSGDQTKELEGNLDRIFGESDAYPNYEGRTGASPREIKTLILNAAQNPRFGCVSPLALFEEIDELCKNVTVYEFLKQEPLPGGYHENRKFIQVVQGRYLDLVDDELRGSMGLVEESQYAQLFERYVNHVSHWVKKEKLRNPHTGRLEDPDEGFMLEVEKTIGVGTKRDEFRHEVISRIGAWSIDHPNQKPSYADVFPKAFTALRESYYEQQKKVLKRTGEDLLVYVTDGAHAIGDSDARSRAEHAMHNLKERYGYCEKCAKEAVSLLLRQRYA